MTNMTEQLIKITQQVNDFENKYHREPASVQLLIVSKNQPIEKIAKAFEAGQHAFGESYLQEALPKVAALPAIEWHFIGPLQSNKTRKIAEHFSWVHSVDSEKIATRLNEQRPPHLPPLNVCIQVNVSEEATKSGLKISEIASLANICMQLPHLRLRGLMTIPRPSHDFAKQREEFHKLLVLWQALRKQYFSLDTLSMGMSNDFEAAIAEGSTLVRIGHAFWEE
ncbi:MAG: YggS family pyridoxal phosphate-dependent enzyme [Gammaproteobacteria bacterium]|nr:YggS family pyridoxal phosphate-dependent enzyme [Gammaproteobacteria bacterium]